MTHLTLVPDDHAHTNASPRADRGEISLEWLGSKADAHGLAASQLRDTVDAHGALPHPDGAPDVVIVGIASAPSDISWL